MDEDKDGNLNFNEFLALSMKLQNEHTTEALGNLFRDMDKDKDKYLTMPELKEGMKQFLGKQVSCFNNYK